MINKEKTEFNTAEEIIQDAEQNVKLDAEAKRKKRKVNKIKVTVLDYAKTIAISTVLTLLFLTFVGQLTVVVGNSMEPTYHDGQRLIVEKITRNYERYDVIVFKASPTEKYIKRIYGLPGETIKIEANIIYVNGEPIGDVFQGIIEYYGIAAEEITLGEDEYFVMGDNRNDSGDSRYKEIGPIHKDKIIGKIFKT